MINKYPFYSVFIICILLSCNKEQPKSCTEEFRTIGITVIGDSLSTFYTLRSSTSDKIRLSSFNGFSENNWYPVLDDNYVNQLSDKQENFRFVGLKNDSILVNEEFIIRSDGCHIEKVSGKDQVVL